MTAGDRRHGRMVLDIMAAKPFELAQGIRMVTSTYTCMGITPSYVCRWYPETGGVDEVGAAGGVGANVNVPWTKNGMSDSDYLAAFSLVTFHPSFTPPPPSIACTLPWRSILFHTSQSYPTQCTTPFSGHPPHHLLFRARSAPHIGGIRCCRW